MIDEVGSNGFSSKSILWLCFASFIILDRDEALVILVMTFDWVEKDMILKNGLVYFTFYDYDLMVMIKKNVY